MTKGNSSALHGSASCSGLPCESRPSQPGELLRSVCVLPNGKDYLVFYLHFLMMKLAFKMPLAVARGCGTARAQSGRMEAPLHLISPFRLNIMPHPD